MKQYMLEEIAFSQFCKFKIDAYSFFYLEQRRTHIWKVSSLAFEYSYMVNYKDYVLVTKDENNKSHNMDQ